MKSWALTLTVLLAVLLSTAPPVAADHCCASASCCPPGECQCHLSAALPTQPAPETPATLPALTDAIAPAATAYLHAIAPIATLHLNLTAGAAKFPAAPLYALTHAFLI